MIATSYFFAVVTWALIPAFQTGYHISALNQIQASMSCLNYTPSSTMLSLPSCIRMDDAEFGVLTSLFNLGGLFGSLSGGATMHRLGRRGASAFSAIFLSAGSLLMAFGASYLMLLLGRLIIGIGIGLGVSVVPIYLSETAPPKIRGSIGVLTQLAIVTGLLVTQAVGIPLAGPSIWRFVLVISALISLAQVVTCGLIVETPAWLADRGLKSEADAVTRRLWGSRLAEDSAEGEDPSDADAEQPLLAADNINQPPIRLVSRPISVLGLFTSKEVRRPVSIVIWAFLAQQGSGINAILYYSNNILGRVLPNLAAYISLLITVVNFIMTIPTIFVIEHVGARRIFLASVVGSIISLVAVALGINGSSTVLSSLGVLAFVTWYSIGLGSVPFIIMSEIVPFNAIGSTASLAVAFNSGINIVIAVGFLPLRDFLSRDNGGEGNVFYIFAIILGISGFAVYRMHHNH